MTLPVGDLVASIRMVGLPQFEQDNARARPERREGVGLVTQGVGAVECAIDERERRGHFRHACGRHASGRGQVVKDEPQPQVVFAFGLRITNCAPCRLSL